MSKPLRQTMSRSARYGVDAPMLVPMGIAALGVFIASVATAQSLLPIVVTAIPLVCAAIGLHATLRGKFSAWNRLLDALALRGDEHVLDLGCGRGAVLIAAARRLPGGRACGVDIWRRVDQSGNAASATRTNARVEGVLDRVRLVTGSMTDLPFASASFDVLTSSIAMHNISGADGRQRALEEAVRVLRPGGRLLLADMVGTRKQAEWLRSIGWTEVSCRSLGWQMWWGGPWLPTRVVAATKPLAHAAANS